MLGVDDNLITRSKYNLGVIARYSVSKEVLGDPECHKKYTILLDRISNLIYALDSTELSILSIDDQYCLYHRLFSLIQTNSNIPGFVQPTDITLDGIGNMYVSFGNGNLFIIT